MQTKEKLIWLKPSPANEKKETHPMWIHKEVSDGRYVDKHGWSLPMGNYR